MVGCGQVVELFHLQRAGSPCDPRRHLAGDSGDRQRVRHAQQRVAADRQARADDRRGGAPHAGDAGHHPMAVMQCDDACAIRDVVHGAGHGDHRAGRIRQAPPGFDRRARVGAGIDAAPAAGFACEAEDFRGVASDRCRLQVAKLLCERDEGMGWKTFRCSSWLGV
jgi:hypothetical protein